MHVRLEHRSRDSSVGVVTRVRAGRLRNLVPVPEGAKIWRRVSKNCAKRLLALSCLSVRPSVSPHGTTRLSLDEFCEILYLTIF
jgi:hypothetical protein